MTGAPFLLLVLFAFLAIVGATCIGVAVFDLGVRRAWWAD
jgi:hypothetical protein